VQPDAKRRQGLEGKRGSVLTLAAISLVVLLAMAGLAIDLAMLYVARSEAQRAADAAALAGAQVFAGGGCLGLGDCSTQESQARSAAEGVGGQNAVVGQAAQIQDGDVTFNYPKPTDPEVTVVVQRTSARTNAIPLFFMRIFGIDTADVSATATAEAFAGGSINCPKPWILPNCDPNETPTPSGNSNCPPGAGPYAPYFINPDGTVNTAALGETITLKPGQPSDSPAPGKFYPIYIPSGFTPSFCPECAGKGVTPSPGAAWYQENIECCNSSFLQAGTQTVTPTTGNQQGPTGQGVMCLINQIKNTTTGQDTYPCGTDPATPYGVGSNNPLVGTKDANGNSIVPGSCTSASNSVITVPLYNGSSLCPGAKNCPTTNTVDIQGFLEVFVVQVTPSGPNQGNVTAYILNLVPGNAPVISAGGGAIKVRLIHN
jgi:Putative Flp pilus-assembly TadE/G-like